VTDTLTPLVTAIGEDDLESPARGVAVFVTMMGAPTVMVEKTPRGDGALIALRALEHHLGRSADAAMPIACGGINSMIPLVVAATTAVPVRGPEAPAVFGPSCSGLTEEFRPVEDAVLVR
jgi:DUF917 family protein